MQKIVEVYQKYWDIQKHCGVIDKSTSPMPLSECKKIDILGKKKGRYVCMIYNKPFRKGLAIVNLIVII